MQFKYCICTSSVRGHPSVEGLAVHHCLVLAHEVLLVDAQQRNLSREVREPTLLLVGTLPQRLLQPL